MARSLYRCPSDHRRRDRSIHWKVSEAGRACQARGFEVRLIYVFIADPEEQLERIRLRVAKGGHDVPKDKVLERRSKSLRQLGWFFDQADEAWIYDNGGAAPKLIGRKQGNNISLSSSVPQEMMQNLLNPLP